MKIRVMIVEDFQLMRRGLAQALEHDPGIEVVGEAQDGDEALEAAPELEPDVLLLDLQMPRCGGMAVLERLRESHPQVRALVVTASSNPDRLLNAVAAGAAGYLRKDASPTELRQAVITVHGGGSYIAPALAGHLLREFAPAVAQEDRPVLNPLLTGREGEILRLLAQGYTDKEIGCRLFLSPRTVQSHLAAVREKTGVRRRSQLVRWAIEQTLA